MENDNKKRLLQLTNDKARKIWALVLLLVGIAATAVLLYFENKDLDNAPNAVDVDKKGEFVSFNVSLLTDYVATYGNDSYQDKYYIASDDQYMMIIKIDSSDIKKFKSIMDYTYGDIEEKPESIKITGMCDTIPSELKNIVISYYNKNLGNDTKLTSSNFSDYFGTCYIDMSKSPYDTYKTVATLVLAICNGGFLILVIVIVTNALKTKNTIKNLEAAGYLDSVLNEFDSMSAQKFDMQNVILTDNFVIDYTNHLTVVKYTDIVWMYEYTYRYNGVDTQRYIKIMNNKRKMVFVGSKNSRGKHYDLFKDLFIKLADKCPNALVGYNSDNIKKTNRKNFDETLKEINSKNL